MGPFGEGGGGHADVLLDEQDGQPAGVERADRVHDLADDQRREPGRRLVEEKDARPPNASAATSLSRMAIIARPTRERTVFQAAPMRPAVTAKVMQ